MPAPPPSRDPRSVITPDAFHVHPELLGLPLASPGRRLVAMLLDVVVIGVLAVVTRSFALVLTSVVAVTLLRSSVRASDASGTALGAARRASIGCLGAGIAFVTVLVWIGIAFDGDGGDDSDGDRGSITIDLGLGRVDVDVPDGPSAAPGVEPIESRDADAIRDGVTLYTPEEALEAYAALLRSGTDTEADRELALALRTRLALEMADDTVGRLQQRIDALEREVTLERLQRSEAEQELEDATSGELWGWLADRADDLGFGFGWAALYMTVLLTTMNGQTLGKRLLGIRVRRLDGHSITWWIAFERAGGYAAGFATGLLGFAQVYWDANRQAIHDRIVGTVVVRDGVDRIDNWDAREAVG